MNGLTMGTYPIGLNQLTPYEREFLSMKILSQWLSLEGTIEMEGQEVFLDTFESHIMFLEVADSFRDFRNHPVTSKHRLKEEDAQKLEKALRDAYYANRPDTEIVEKIQKGELVFLSAGWNGHDVTLSFSNGYLAICNRGERDSNSSTIEVYKFNPSKITEKIIQEIKRMKSSDFNQGNSFFYSELPDKLWGYQNEFCNSFRTDAPSDQKVKNCSLSSKLAALRFAMKIKLVMTPELARKEYKMYKNFSILRAMDHFLSFPKESKIHDLFLQAKKKVEKNSHLLDELLSQ